MQVLSKLRLPAAPVIDIDVARKEDIVTGEGVNYSLTPKDTGVKWIDGQPVWRRVFVTASGLNPNVSNPVIDIPAGWGFHGLARLDGYLTTADGIRTPLQYYGGAADDYLGVRITETGVITERHGGVDKNNRPMVLILDYISYPTGTSSWDGGTASWDGGTSWWDAISGQMALWDEGTSTWR